MSPQVLALSSKSNHAEPQHSDSQAPGRHRFAASQVSSTRPSTTSSSSSSSASPSRSRSWGSKSLPSSPQRWDAAIFDIQLDYDVLLRGNGIQKLTSSSALLPAAGRRVKVSSAARGDPSSSVPAQLGGGGARRATGPKSSNKSAIARVSALDGLDAPVTTAPMRQDSLPLIRSTADDLDALALAEQVRAIEQRTSSGSVKRPRTSAGGRSSQSRVKSLFSRSQSHQFSLLEPDTPKASGKVRGISSTSGLASSSSVPSVSLRSPSPRSASSGSKHVRAKSVSAALLIRAQRDEVPLLPTSTSRSVSGSDETATPHSSAPLFGSTKSSSSWFMQRLRPSTSSASLHASSQSMTPSNSQSLARPIATLPESTSTSSVSAVRTRATSELPSKLRSKGPKTDVGFIKAIGSLITGSSRGSKCDEMISDEELLSWRRGRNTSTVSGESGRTSPTSDLEILTSSEHPREDSSTKETLTKGNGPAARKKDDEVLVIEKIGGVVKRLPKSKRTASCSNPFSNSNASRSACSSDTTTSLSFDTSIYGPASLTPKSNINADSSRALSPSQDLLESICAADRFLSSSSPVPPSPSKSSHSDSRGLHHTRSAGSLGPMNGVEAACQLAASLSSSPNSAAPAPPTPVVPLGGLAPRPAAMRKKSSVRALEPQNETRRYISNEAWEQVSLSARKGRSRAPTIETATTTRTNAPA